MFLAIVDEDESNAIADGLFIKFNTFEFVFHVQVLHNLFKTINILSETLQKDDLDITSACKIAETTLNALKNLRISAKGFNDAYDESVKIATANSNPTPEATETDKKRKRRRTQDNTDDDLNNQRYQLIFNFQIF